MNKSIALAAAVLMTGCTSIPPRTAGKASGTAAYLAYTRAAEKKDQKFKDNVAAIWRTVNAIDSVDQLIEQVDELDSRFAQVIASDKLSASDKAALQAVRDMVVRVIYDKAAGRLEGSDALEYLQGVRDGVNMMIRIYGGN